MTIRINNEGLAVPVSLALVEYLSGLVDDCEVVDSITFNFKDPNYTATEGDYHPVEIRIEADVSSEGSWSLCYITDFQIIGMGQCEELVIDADFNFESNQYNTFYGSHPLPSADEYYPMWEANFITYAKEFDVFTIVVTRGD